MASAVPTGHTVLPAGSSGTRAAPSVLKQPPLPSGSPCVWSWHRLMVMVAPCGHRDAAHERTREVRAAWIQRAPHQGHLLQRTAPAHILNDGAGPARTPVRARHADGGHAASVRAVHAVSIGRYECAGGPPMPWMEVQGRPGVRLHCERRGQPGLHTSADGQQAGGIHHLAVLVQQPAPSPAASPLAAHPAPRCRSSTAAPPAPAGARGARCPYGVRIARAAAAGASLGWLPCATQGGGQGTKAGGQLHALRPRERAVGGLQGVCSRRAGGGTAAEQAARPRGAVGGMPIAAMPLPARCIIAVMPAKD